MQASEKIKSEIGNILLITFFSIMLIGSIFGPSLYDDIQEGYIQNSLLSAQPVKQGSRVVGSSSQVRYRGKQYTLTNKHICDIATDIEGITEGNLINVGNSLRKVLYVDVKHDLCILQPNLKNPPLRLASSYKLSQRVRVIGHPRGIEQTVREGRIIGRGSDIFSWVHFSHQIPYIRVSTIGYPGNSGSPLLDFDGDIIGVIFAGDGYHTEMWAVPLDSIKEMFKDYLAK